MASRKKTSKGKTRELAAESDPAAPLDSKSFIAAAQPVLKVLAQDLLARADGSTGVTRALEARHEAERKAERTADSYAVWRRNFVGQVADAWLLSVVFVRTLEDRGLLPAARIAGPGATDSQQLFSELAPSLTERDYLLMVFKELSHFPAAAALFDSKHNPVWKLSPSAEAARELLGLFRLPNAETPAFRFGHRDTRFLGDLYQDLDEDVQKRFALLQTPRFIEHFILDRTLEPAIERFGLDEATLIDPACGSGHFLLGAFDRLFAHQQREKPGLDVRELARLALDAIAGADINPYAIAIARFRLTLSYLEKTGLSRLRDAPELPLHLAVADSLLHNPHKKLEGDRASWRAPQTTFGELEGASAREWEGEEFALEDEIAARDVLYKRYAAVVGNPPYITVKDAVLRERYRTTYSTAAGKYSVAVPFTERFFQLARDRGAVGMITANSFMKREFGKKLVEEFLPTANLTEIVNTSGAYIPGHGTPTVLLFGTAEGPQSDTVLTVLAKRGEPSTPEDAEQGMVWRSIADHGRDIGFDNDYITVAEFQRIQLADHPWSLGGGGASDLMALLEATAQTTLGAIVDSVGIASFTLEDDAYLRSGDGWARVGAPPHRLRSMVTGEVIRDWGMEPDLTALFPYDEDLQILADGDPALRLIWPFRTCLANNKLFGSKTKVEGGLKWYEYGRLTASKLRTPLTITFAFVATHNHFVLDRGGKVFNRSAPIIKLPEGATEEDHLALLAYLNSSTACFWMKQVFFEKSSQNYVGDVRDKPERIHYEFAGTQLKELPVPDVRRLSRFGARLEQLAKRREDSSPRNVLRRERVWITSAELSEALEDGKRIDASALREAVFLQEELDWLVYSLFGLSDSVLAPDSDEVVGESDAEARPYAAAGLPVMSQRWGRRANAIISSDFLRVLEQPLYKRPWLGVQGVFHRDGWTYDSLAAVALEEWLLDRMEQLLRANAAVLGERALAAGANTDQSVRAIVEFRAHTLHASEDLTGLLGAEAVPFVSAQRFSDSGLEKFRIWQHTWDLQRDEDAGKPVGAIPVPPKYAQNDFRDSNYWRLRGKLDVPKERFISYPGCESDEDGEPIYGWAGWNHLERAQALAELYTKRKNEEAWGKDRLTPMLAGLLELIPWLKQWHNDPSEEFGGLRLGDYFADFLDAQCSELGLTRDDLLAWRPTKQKAGKHTAEKERGTEEGASVPKKKRAKKKQQLAGAENVPDAGADGMGGPQRRAETRHE